MFERIPIDSRPGLRDAVESLIDARGGSSRQVDPFDPRPPDPHEVIVHDGGGLTLTRRVKDTVPIEGGGLVDETIHLSPREEEQIRSALSDLPGAGL